MAALLVNDWSGLARLLKHVGVYYRIKTSSKKKEKKKQIGRAHSESNKVYERTTRASRPNEATTIFGN